MDWTWTSSIEIDEAASNGCVGQVKAALMCRANRAKELEQQNSYRLNLNLDSCPTLVLYTFPPFLPLYMSTQLAGNKASIALFPSSIQF
jgi:hypothetical protein